MGNQLSVLAESGESTQDGGVAPSVDAGVSSSLSAGSGNTTFSGGSVPTPAVGVLQASSAGSGESVGQAQPFVGTSGQNSLFPPLSSFSATQVVMAGNVQPPSVLLAGILRVRDGIGKLLFRDGLGFLRARDGKGKLRVRDGAGILRVR